MVEATNPIGADVFLFLAAVPGVIALVYFLTSQLPRLLQTTKLVRDYDARAKTFQRSSVTKVNPLTDLWVTNPTTWYHALVQVVTGSLLVVAIFVLVAIIAKGQGIPFAATVRPAPVVGAVAPAPSHAVAQPVSADVPSAGIAAATDARGPTATGEGLRGLIYAGFGAYVYVLLGMVGRLNASALSGKYLMNGTLRTAIGLTLGFAAGAVDLFAFLNQGQKPFLYVAIGLFPEWALSAVRDQARQVFKAPAPGDQPLSIQNVDGLDEDNSGRLAELGISDVQHLATADPREIAVTTLFPIRRVLDWIDQAILITYVRERIVAFRKAGVRSAMDLAYLFEHATGAAGTAAQQAQAQEMVERVVT